MRNIIQMTALIGLVLTTTLSFAQSDRVLVEWVQGNPQIFEQHQGTIRKVSRVSADQYFTLPIEIKAGPEDSAMLRLNDSKISVSPNTVLHLKAPETEETGLVQRVIQNVGSALFDIMPGTVDKFQVETPYLVSVVKGTTFNILVTEKKATVALQEGRLLILPSNGGRSFQMRSGDIFMMDRQGTPEFIPADGSRTMAGTGSDGFEGITSDSTANQSGVDTSSPRNSLDTLLQKPQAAKSLAKRDSTLRIDREVGKIRSTARDDRKSSTLFDVDTNAAIPNSDIGDVMDPSIIELPVGGVEEPAIIEQPIGDVVDPVIVDPVVIEQPDSAVADPGIIEQPNSPIADPGTIEQPNSPIADPGTIEQPGSVTEPGVIERPDGTVQQVP